MTGMQFDNKITSGNLLTIGALIVGLVAGYTNLQALLDRQASQISSLESEVNGSEIRVRTLEIQQAGQSSDLRNIQIGINEIKTAVERLGAQRGLK